ncbi:hypothetical protein B0H13DRAFT_2354377 [Mycena leptocephala]|nr:hypothetical protein B0H13DRAFT_2354377 [Mycena leptocephala]
MLDEMDEGCADEDDEWEDEALVASRAPTPLSRAPTPLSRSASTSSPFAQHHASLSRSPSPLSELSDPPSPLPLDDPDAARRRHRADKKKKRRQRKRVARAQTAKSRLMRKYRCLFQQMGGSSTLKKTKLTRHRLRTLKALLEDNNDLVQWDGRGIKLIVDAEGRIVAVLLGRPDDEDWDEVVRQFELLMEGFGSVGKSVGYSRHKTVSTAVARGLARYVPKLYGFLSTTLKGIYEKHPELEQLFTNSVFLAATWNLGPDVVTEEHNDLLNFGMCGISSGGNYNYKRGGHLWLKQLKLVVEFPSGSSVLIPSAAYAAGALLRWARYGYQSVKALLGQAGGKAKKELIDGDPEARAAWALGLFSKIDELEEDRRAVFGRDY